MMTIQRLAMAFGLLIAAVSEAQVNPPFRVERYAMGARIRVLKLIPKG